MLNEITEVLKFKDAATAPEKFLNHWLYEVYNFTIKTLRFQCRDYSVALRSCKLRSAVLIRLMKSTGLALAVIVHGAYCFRSVPVFRLSPMDSW